SDDGTARLWSRSGELVQEFKGHQGRVWSVSFSPDGQQLATASDDGTARLWSRSGELVQEFKGHQGRVWSVSFSPDGQQLATASSDGTARLWPTSLEGLLARSCEWLRDYLTYSSGVKEEERQVCGFEGRGDRQ
ncbi:MAG: hypothetical protein F6K19_49390, partial [Cyanothece sp. SIO1E1]|nr:hypothetical protein [Cyanothece sp. SIO1E1]